MEKTLNVCVHADNERISLNIHITEKTGHGDYRRVSFVVCHGCLKLMNTINAGHGQYRDTLP